MFTIKLKKINSFNTSLSAGLLPPSRQTARYLLASFSVIKSLHCLNIPCPDKDRLRLPIVLCRVQVEPN